MDTVNRMTESVRHSKFNLPIFLFPFVAFGVYLMADTVSGNLAVSVCDKFELFGADANRVQLFSALLNVILIALWVRFLEARSIRALGFYPNRKKDLFKGSALGFTCFAIVLLCAFVFQQVEVLQKPYTKPLVSVLLMIPFWFLQAAGEEVFLRGWVLPTMTARANTFVGVTVSSVLFVFLHSANAGLNTLAVLNLFLFGVLLALFTLKTDSIWLAISFHALWNFAEGSFFGMSVSGSTMRPNLMNLSVTNTLLNGGSFGLEASVYTTVLLVLLLTATYVRKERS